MARWRERGEPPPERLVRFNPADWPADPARPWDAASRWGDAALAWFHAHEDEVERFHIRLNGAWGPVEILAETVRLKMCLLVGCPPDTPIQDVHSGRWRGCMPWTGDHEDEAAAVAAGESGGNDHG